MPSGSTAIHTFHDVIDHLLDHFGGVEQGRNVKMAKRSVLSAYRGLPAAYNWSYYYRRGRVTTQAAYSTGTVAYDHAGGANERMVTLTGGTWPSWVARGLVRIDSIDYSVDERKSDTVLTLSINSNPGSDIASGKSYTVSRDSYPLPVDFQSADQFRNATKNTAWPTYVDPGSWLDAHQSLESSNNPRIYCIMADPDFIGTMAVRFYPPPTASNDFDFVYQRFPTSLRVSGYTEGTIGTTAASAVVTGSGTVFTSDMKGSIIRVGTTTENPSGVEGLNPYVEERVIISVDSATQVTVDSGMDNTSSGAKYRISDPIDIEDGVMYEAFLAYSELRLSMLLKDDDIPLKEDIYAGSLRMAMQADNRSYAEDGGQSHGHVSHLRDLATVTPNA